MPFSEPDFIEFARLLQEHPEWRQELRRLVLADEILSLPLAIQQLTARVESLATQVGLLAEAQRRTEERLEALAQRVDALAEAQRRTEERLEALAQRVDALAEAQRRTEERLEALAQRVDALAEAQRRTEERVDALAEAQRRTEERLEALAQRVDALAEAQRRTEERLEALAQRVDALAEAQRRTEERLEALAQRVDALAEAQRRTEERVDALVEREEETRRELAAFRAATEERFREMADDLGQLKGSDLERTYRERAPAYFGRLLEEIDVLSPLALSRLLDAAVKQGKLSWDDRESLMDADIVIKGRLRDAGREAVLVVEVSWGLGPADVERASRRASLLGKLAGEALPVVAGKSITPEARELARRLGVVVVMDGRVQPEGT